MNFLKEIVIGTVLESPARAISRTWRKIKPSEWDVRIQRDNNNIQRLLSELLKPNSNCVDIGAHKGDFLQRFLELSPEGHHYAFEPLPHLAEKLQHQFPQIEVFNYALSDEEGNATFYHVVDMPEWSGLQKQPYPNKTNLEPFDVTIKRLDDLIPQNVQINFIKIDVEGAEFGVLKGAAATIKRCQPSILFEHAKIHNTNYGTQVEMVYDLLVNDYGLSIYSLDQSEPLTKDKFVSIYNDSYTSNYDRNAETNFLAMPR